MAQTQKKGLVSGILYDTSTSEFLVGAVVEFVEVNNPENKIYVSSVLSGKFSMNLTYGTYQLKASFLGLDDYTQVINVDQDKVQVPIIKMTPKATAIDEVVMEVQAMRTSLNGDTIIYNADAYKVADDVEVDGLIAKMPGIVVTDDGVEAQGETVEKVFVDGKEFFGNDVTTAIKNLPAMMVDKIEILDKMSDNAEFTGIDDGESYKAMNIVTKKNMRVGKFGKFTAQYGYPDKYYGGATVNFFNSKRRITLLAQANNLNVQNFSTDDILGATNGSKGKKSRGNSTVGKSKGISEVIATGLNYSEEFGKKVDLQGSYFFNFTQTDNTAITNRDYVADSVDSNYWWKDYYNTTKSYNSNMNHRLNAVMKYKIDDNNQLTFRPSVTYQDYSSTSASDQLINYVNAETGDFAAVLNNIINKSESENNGYNISGNLYYRTKFEKPGRNLSASLSATMSKNDKDSWSDKDYVEYYSSTEPDTLDVFQDVTTDTRSLKVSGSMTYNEPISTTTFIAMNYKFSYNKSESEKYSYDDEEHTNLWDDYSSVYYSNYMSHNIGPSVKVMTDKVMLNATGTYQNSMLTGERVYPTANEFPKTTYTFHNILYNAMLTYKMNKTNNLRVSLNSSTDNPSVTQLATVADISNTESVTAGNANLKTSYTHKASLRYMRTSTTKGRSFMMGLSASLENNYITDSTYTVSSGVNDELYGATLEDKAEVTVPVNMNGHFQASVNMSFGTPFNFLSSNVNVSLAYRLTQTPSYYNGKSIFSTGNYYTYRLVLGSNISENVDFTLGYNGGYTEVRNTYDNSLDAYMTHSGSMRIKITFLKIMTFAATGTYSGYIGDNYDEHYTILNAYLGTKLTKRKLLELSIGVNDILDQNKSFSVSSSTNYTQTQTNEVLGRYAVIKAVYSLRSFGDKDAREQMRNSRGERPDGPPMDGMGGGEGRGGGRGPGGGGGGGRF
ncbi:MAG: outer membrane beta-barrel protein [Rikenellaceae bacterium]